MKKMRRLIPAIAMLLVSAVMLSTASFAWFTMNTKATASGMQIQAEADSSLVISEAPLKYNTGLTTVDFKSDVEKLIPMTYGEYVKTTTDENSGTVTTNEKGWVVPGLTNLVNPDSGAMDSTDAYISAGISKDEDNGYYIQKELYLGSAGDAMTGKKLTVTLAAPVHSTGDAYRAYAAAIYVIENTTANASAWADNGTVAVDMEPTAIVYVDDSKDETYTEGRNTVELPGTYNIPSIVGVGQQGNTTTGLKIIIRFYVDGALTSTGNNTVDVPNGSYIYTSQAGKKWNAAATYFVGETDTVAAPTPDMVDGESLVPDGWYTRVADTDAVNYKYIRSKDVPTAASQLEISFSTAG